MAGQAARRYPAAAAVDRGDAGVGRLGAGAVRVCVSGVGWHLTCFGNRKGYPVPLGPAPKTVESVMNYRIVHQRHVVAGVSGGVRVDPAERVRRYNMEADAMNLLHGPRSTAAPQSKDLPGEAWWWD